MLLNLLVAMLSTSHAQVQDDAGRELKVSKARTVAHYRWFVDNDLLPAPFNLVQIALSMGARLSNDAKSKRRRINCKGGIRLIIALETYFGAQKLPLVGTWGGWLLAEGRCCGCFLASIPCSVRMVHAI